MKRALIGAVAATTLALTSSGIASASVAWTIQLVPMPAGAAAGELVGVSCPTATSCMAVGNAGGVAAAERWSGGAWSPGVLPLPAGAAFSTLSGISCPDPGHCIAVGYYRNSFGSDDLLAERWQSGTWKIQKIPAPANGLRLSAVSCTSDTSCTAVGESAVGPDADATLAEHWDGSSWTVQPTPNPAGTTFSFLSGLSCPSASSCTAVGFYINSANAYQNLAEQWNGSTWSVRAISNPAGQPDAGLDAVSCTSPASCTAVGTASSSGMAAQWNGSTWSVRTIAPPAGGTIVSLTGISCPSAASCTAVGQLSSGSVKNRALAERWNGSSWDKQETAQPAARQRLTAISCTASRTCTAVGSSGPPNVLQDQLMAEHE